MKRTVAVAALILLGACATAPRQARPATWLVGTWLMMEPDLEFPTACASGLPIRYEADGRLRIFEGRGTWRLDGDRLTETMTEADEDVADPADLAIGSPLVARIERRGEDSFRKTYADGTVETFRRCP